MTRENDLLPSRSDADRGVLRRRAAIWTIGAASITLVLLALVGPFFAMPGAAVHPFTSAMLAGSALLPVMWLEAISASARAKGYRVRRRAILLILVTVPFAVWLLLGHVGVTHELSNASRIREPYFTAEWTLVVLAPGLTGVFGSIVVALFPDRPVSRPQD